VGTGDGTVASSTKIVDHGSDDLHWTLVILGDGFRAAEMAQYQQKVTDLVNGLQGVQPFGRLWNHINVHRIDVHSDESGADDPAACGGPGTTRRTYFDATFCGVAQVRRAVTVNNVLVLSTINAHVSSVEAIVVLVNSTDLGYATVDNVTACTLHPDFILGVAHELGHVLGLADEYDYLSHCPPGDVAGHDTYTGTEAELKPNVTTVTDRSRLKWRHKLVFGPMVRMDNPNCTMCDTRPNPSPGAVGLFGGANTFRCGVFRAQYDCVMRTVDPGTPFCVVCQEAMEKEILKATTVERDCFLATAVYGDPGHPDVDWLRDWRNRQLARGVPAGPAMRALVAAYGRLGPPLARFTVTRPRLARLLRERAFGPAVAALRRRSPSGPLSTGDGT
jgi:hypothetical protein